MSVNKVILIGNVGNDPKMHYPEKSSAFAFFSLATNERIGQVERTEWHNIVLSGKGAEYAERYIRKGSKLYVEGKLRTRTYTDKMGVQRYITEIYADNFEILGRGAQEIQQ
ncbi:MAG: single-stranded DNA-binding protein [Prevotella sp.]|nr:single-stranded DNA-binding protein [Prevotella sp.]MCM1074319.1 single-stranded DNA-binding protein [Ruminococcus sp.]